MDRYCDQLTALDLRETYWGRHATLSQLGIDRCCKLRSLTLSVAEEELDFSKFPHLRDLKLLDCDELETLTGITELHKLHILGGKITELPDMPNLREGLFESKARPWAAKLNKIGEMPLVRKLVIRKSRITKLSDLPEALEVELVENKRQKTIGKMPLVSKLVIRRSYLDRLPDLPSALSVELVELWALKRILSSQMQEVQTLRIEECPSFQSLPSSLPNLHSGTFLHLRWLRELPKMPCAEELTVGWVNARGWEFAQQRIFTIKPAND